MLELEIPGTGRLELEHLVLDYNGTLGLDGALLPGVAERLAALAKDFHILVATADTFGTVRQALARLPVTVRVLGPGPEDQSKLDIVAELGAASCVTVGNGRNDRLMLARAGLGMAVLGPEGAHREALAAATVMVPDIRAGLDLLLHPKRLVATLRC